jgi:hypothetical protein
MLISVFLELSIYSYLTGFDLLAKVGLLNKRSRKLIYDNSRKGIMSGSR